MAKNIKIKTTFSYLKLANNMNKIIADGLNMMAVRLNKSLQENLDKSVDINNQPFEKLGPARLAERAAKGTGSKPLVETGNMRKTRVIKAKGDDPVAKIKMMGKKKGIYYGAMHNEGYVVSSGKFKGSEVPQRRWFGMTEDMKAGGKENDKVMNLIKRDIRKKWRKKLLG